VDTAPNSPSKLNAAKLALTPLLNDLNNNPSIDWGQIIAATKHDRYYLKRGYGKNTRHTCRRAAQQAQARKQAEQARLAEQARQAAERERQRQEEERRRKEEERIRQEEEWRRKEEERRRILAEQARQQKIKRLIVAIEPSTSLLETELKKLQERPRMDSCVPTECFESFSTSMEKDLELNLSYEFT